MPEQPHLGQNILSIREYESFVRRHKLPHHYQIKLKYRLPEAEADILFADIQEQANTIVELLRDLDNSEILNREDLLSQLKLVYSNINDHTIKLALSHILGCL